MKLIFVNDLFISKTVQAVCWTLIHSLWQGLLLAIITGLVIVFTKKAGSSLRYNILTCLFISFLVSVFFTFLLQYKKTITGIGSSDEINLSRQVQTISPLITVDNPEEKFSTEKFVEFLNRNTYPIVVVWLIVLIFKCVRLGFSLNYIYRIKTRKTYETSDYWKELVKELAARLRMYKPVRMMESGIVQVPVVIGFLKPVILVPVGLLANVPSGQVEAILLHELAHIKRKDYLVNLVQSIAEIIFFFNPAVLWLSSLIRDERENCCDDVAISVTNDKTKFIKALISFQELNSPVSPYALSFPGKKNQLLSRVKRIIHNENKKLNAMEKTILVVSIVSLSFLAMFSQAKLQAQTTSPKSEVTEVKKDTVPAKKPVSPNKKNESETEADFSNMNFRVNTNDNDNIRESTIEATSKNGVRYKFTKINDKLTELYVDGKKISEDQYSSYTSVIGDIEAAVAIRRENMKEEHRRRMEMRKQDMLQRQKELQETMAKKRANREMELHTQKELALNQHRIIELQTKKHLETQKKLELKHKEILEHAIEKRVQNEKEMTIKMLELQERHNARLKENIIEQRKQEIEMTEKVIELRKKQKDIHEKQLKEIELEQQKVNEKIEEIKRDEKNKGEKNKDDLNSLYQDQKMINSKLNEIYARQLALNKGLVVKDYSSKLALRKSPLFSRNAAQRAYTEQRRLYSQQASKQRLLLQRHENDLKRVKKARVEKVD